MNQEQPITSVFVPEKDFSNVGNYNHIPFELQTSNIWLIAADENGKAGGKIPHVILSNGTLQRFSRSMEHTTLAFSQAVAFSDEYGYGIGILLTTDDHLCVIDLDAKNLDEATESQRMKSFSEIVGAFDSYTEISTSGKGYHIVIKTSELIARNSRSTGIEIYSYKNRFMVCTGNRVELSSEGVIVPAAHSKVISYKDNELNQLVEKLGFNETDIDYAGLDEREAVKTDEEVLNEILASYFGEKYIEIASYSDNTDYSKTPYPSASEAVLAIVGIIVRFTESNEQARRLFKDLDIAKRDKYTRNNYHIDRCLVRARASIDYAEVDTFVANTVSLYYQRSKEILDERMRQEEELLRQANVHDEAVDYSEIELQYDARMEEFFEIPEPHGLIGDIYRFTMNKAHHKLKVAALAAAIGVIAGIAGRQYRFNGSSLNQFIVIVAGSTLGKESCTKALNTISKATSPIEGDGFFVFGKLSSPQALRTTMTESAYTSVIATFPEFARLIDQIKQGKDTGAMAGMYPELLDIFSKNSTESEYGGAIMAKTENNRPPVTAPSFSFVGDCTTDFYDGITEEMCSSGFMSRLLILENENPLKTISDSNAHLVELDKEIVEHLSLLIQQVKTKFNANIFIDVEYENAEVKDAAINLEKYLTAKYNKSKDESNKQLYGRTWLRVMTIASLFAVCENLGSPRISMKDFLWSQALVMKSVFNMANKLRNGEIGVSEQTCKQRTLALFERLTLNVKNKPRSSKIKTFDAFLNVGVVPRHLLSSQLQGTSFKIGNLSNTRTLDTIIESMCKDGVISVVTPKLSEFLSTTLERHMRGVYYQYHHPVCSARFNEFVNLVYEQAPTDEAKQYIINLVK